jgi:hypothetical protein
MGAIQGAINSALGTAAVVAGAGKHFKEQQAEAEIKAIDLGEEIKNLESDIAVESKASELIKQGLEPDRASYDPTTDTMLGKGRVDVDENIINRELEVSRHALNVLESKKRAKLEQKLKYEKLFNVLGGGK